METTFKSESIGKPGFLSELRAFYAVLHREWMIFTRYPNWIIAMIIWPLIFPMMYILTGRALSGPDGSGLAVFTQNTGATDFVGSDQSSIFCIPFLGLVTGRLRNPDRRSNRPPLRSGSARFATTTAAPRPR